MCSFSLPVRDIDGRAVAVLPAEIDFTNSDAVRDALLALLDGEPSDVVADMSGTSFCDVSGARAIVRAHRRAQVAGSRLSVVITHTLVQRVFMLTGADSVLRIYPTVGRALAGYGTDADTPPGRPPEDGAPGAPLPQAPRAVTHPASGTTPAQHRNAKGAGDGTLNAAHQDGHADRVTGSADGTGSPGRSAPEHRTESLQARLHEAISRSSELRSQYVGVFARLAVTYGELADLAEELALQHTLGVEHLKAVSVTARDRSIDCQQLAIGKSRPTRLGRAGSAYHV